MLTISLAICAGSAGAGAGAADPTLEAEGQRFHDAAEKAYQPCKVYFAAQALVRQENLQRREAVLAAGCTRLHKPLNPLALKSVMARMLAGKVPA